MTPVDELPPRETPRRPTLAVAALGLVVGVALESVVLHQMSRSFTPMFEDFEARLPTLTMLFVTWVGYGLAIAVATIAAAVSGGGWVAKKRPLEVGGLAVVVLTAVLLPVLAVVGFYAPIFELASNVR
ncbi:MAG: hypothetical protein KC619_26790 [Myxococcales bacterium]|nr:hypothetical protein [Myxococcales bacterium]